MSDEQGFSEAQSIVSGGRVSTIIAIEIARRHQNLSVREELIFHTDVNHEEGTVYWHGLRLQELELSWLRRIHWVKKLRLARNGFRTLPNEMASFLKQVSMFKNMSYFHAHIHTSMYIHTCSGYLKYF